MYYVKAKDKFTLEQAMKAQKGSRLTGLLFITSTLDEGEWPNPHPGRFTPGKTQYSLYRRLGGHQGSSGWVRNILLPPAFHPGTVTYTGLFKIMVRVLTTCHTQYT